MWFPSMCIVFCLIFLYLSIPSSLDEPEQFQVVSPSAVRPALVFKRQKMNYFCTSMTESDHGA